MYPAANLNCETLEARLNQSVLGTNIAATLASNRIAHPAFKTWTQNAIRSTQSSKSRNLLRITTLPQVQVSELLKSSSPPTSCVLVSAPVKTTTPALTPPSTTTSTIITQTTSSVMPSTTTAAVTTQAVDPVTTTAPAAKTIYNSLIYGNMPQINLPRLDTSAQVWFVGGDASKPLDPQAITTYAHNLVASGTHYVAIDIEANWYNANILKGSQDQVNASISAYLQIIHWLKQAEPTLKVGAFGFPFANYYAYAYHAEGVAYQQGIHMDDPEAVYWGTAGFTQASQYYADIQRANDALKPLLSALDFAAPELYTHIDMSVKGHLQDWKLAAADMIAECRRVMPGKPVLPYLMPKYTPELPQIAETYIPTDAWQQELKTVYQLADGAVIWGGWGPNGRETWDANAGWWNVISTQSYKN